MAEPVGQNDNATRPELDLTGPHLLVHRIWSLSHESPATPPWVSGTCH